MSEGRQSLPVLQDAHLIATETYPLRASALPKLNECPASVFLSQKFWIPGEDDAGGEAAQMGNLVHAAARAFHDVRGTVSDRMEAGLEALEIARQQFPDGNVKTARKHFESYASDKENQEAEVVKNEQSVLARLDPAPFDPTGQPVVIRGKLDQVRLIHGTPKVMDIKTGKKYYGSVALNHYITQQAAYVLAAQQTWGDEFGSQIEPGALICTDGYFRTSKRVFFWHRWGVDAIKIILQNVVNQVAAARMKFLGFVPLEEHCKWCEHKGFEACRAFYEDHIS